MDSTPPSGIARGPFPLVPQPAHALAEEALVADARAGLTPAQMVEHKLASLLKSQPLPVSHMMTAKRTSRSR
jgi:hypothetical protein